MSSSNQGLPKSRRLCTKADFDHVFRDAARFSTANFTLLYRSNQRAYARLGIAISKAKVATAVRRNQLKRLLRESFRLNQKNLPCVDVIVLPKKISTKISTVSVSQIQNAVWVPFLRSAKMTKASSQAPLPNVSASNKARCKKS